MVELVAGRRGITSWDGSRLPWVGLITWSVSGLLGALEGALSFTVRFVADRAGAGGTRVRTLA